MSSTRELDETTPLIQEAPSIQQTNTSSSPATIRPGSIAAHLGAGLARQEGEGRRRRTVKLGRKIMCPLVIVAHHWAVNLEDKWYEIGLTNDREEPATIVNVLQGNKNNAIIPSTGRYAKSCAGFFGGAIVGVTEKKDDEIEAWCQIWKLRNPGYNAMKWNCQKFAVEFIIWLTNDNYKSLPRVNAGTIPLTPKQKNLSGFLFSGLFTIIVYLKLLLRTDDIGSTVTLILLWCVFGLVPGIAIGIGVVRISRARGVNVMVQILIGINVYILLMAIGSIICQCIYFLVDDSGEWLEFIILNFWMPGIISGIGFVITVCVMKCVMPYCTNNRELDQQRQNSNNSISFAVADGGNAIANHVLAQRCASYGPLNGRFEFLSLTTQAVAGPGVGVLVDLSVGDISYSLFGNLYGWHFGSNANTGIGIRNGNFEIHLLGLGGKIGSDGVEINTPTFGVKVCCIL